MRLISTLKRAGYVSSAAALVLTAMPVLPIADAWAADLSDNLTLSADSDECYTIPMDKTVTLDLAGHTLNCGVVVEAGANLTITGNGTITTSAAGQAAIYNKVGGTVTVQNGTFNSTNWYTVKNLGTMTINGGSFTQGTTNASNASMIANGWYNGRNDGASDQGNAYTGAVANLTINGGTFEHYTTTSTIKSDDYSKTTINGGTFTSQNGYLVQATGDVTINNGDFTGYGSMIVFNATGEGSYEPGKVTINNGNINAKYVATGSKGDLDIIGGTFTGLERIIRDSSSIIDDDGIVGGTYNIPVEALLADGKVNYKNADGTYEVADAPDMSGIPARMFVKVSEPTMVEGLSAEVLAHSKLSASKGTFVDGKVTANGVGTFDVAVKPEIYTTDGSGAIVRDTTYDAKTKVHAYDYTDVNVVLPVDGEEALADDTVRVDETYDKYEYSVADEMIATIDADGKVTAVKAGSTDVYATVSIKTLPEVNAQVKIGTIYVYDLDSIEDTYLVKKGGKAKILTDSTWDITATTTSQDVDIVKDGNNFRVNGLNAGLAEVDFVATVGGERKVKTVNVYVYEVNSQDVIVRKGDTVSEAEVEQLIVKGHDDVAMRVKKIDDESIATNDGLALTGVESGETVATYRLAVGTNDAHVNVPVTVHVWDFVTENVEDVYDLGNLQTVTDAFEVYDNGGEISYTVEDASGEDASDAIIVTQNGNEYTITKAETAEAGEYLVKFTDKVLGEEVANKTITVRVHEIVTTGEDENYIVMTRTPLTADGNSYELDVTELNGYSRSQDIVATVTEGLSGVVVEYQNENSWKITANEAGAYEIAFSDGVAKKTITVYVVDFAVEDAEYHLVKGDNDFKGFVKALNEYWKTTWKGSTTGFKVLYESDESYQIQWDGAEAGVYTIDFYAYAGPNRFDTSTRVARDTKSVKVYVYEMVKPEETEYFGEMNGSNEFDVKVADKINDVAAGMAKISYEIVEGETDGITVDIEDGKVTVNKPGKYVVKYTDTMNRGEGDVVDEYTATFEVFNLDADAPKGQFIDLGDTYEYTIDPANTYGDVEVVIIRTDENGNTTEISRTTTTYPNDGEGTFEFAPEEEGKYTVRIENLSAKEHDFREVEKGDFYVIAREYDFKLVRSGTPVEITSNSIWSVDSARDSYNPESLTVEDGKVTLDTSDMELGVRTVTLYHKFGKGQKEALKRVTIAVYDTAVESTEENAEVIDGTIDDLFSKVEELTNNPEVLDELMQKVWDAIAQAMADGEEVDFETVMDTVNDILNENPAFGKAQEMFGPEWEQTLENLNDAVSYGDVIRTRVNVEETIPEDEVRAEILDVLLPYDVDNVDYYDVTVEMYVAYEGDEGEEEYSLGLIHKLNGKITVALAKTTDPETGYTRTYYVVRMHDGEEPEVLVEGEDFYIEDGMIYVVSDKFSTYAVAYRDDLIPAKAPNTGSNTESIEGSVSQNTLSVAIAVMLTLAISLGAFGVEMATRKR